MIRIVLIIIACISLIYLGGLVYLFISQNGFIYFPDYPGREITQTPEDLGLTYEEVELVTSDSVKFTGWFIPAVDARGVLLFCHGNAGNISHRLESIKFFHDLKLSVFIFDYRGYGRSEGKVSELGTYRDVTAAWDYLSKRKEILPYQIIIFGKSLGSGVASWLALHNKPGALILESAFTSIPDLAQEVYPYFPVKLLCRTRYNNLKNLSGITCPIMIIHSQDDEIVPFEHSKKLFEKAGEPKEFMKIEGTHNEGLLTSSDMYKNGLDSFIKKFIKDR